MPPTNNLLPPLSPADTTLSGNTSRSPRTNSSSSPDQAFCSKRRNSIISADKMQPPKKRYMMSNTMDDQSTASVAGHSDDEKPPSSSSSATAATTSEITVVGFSSPSLAASSPSMSGHYSSQGMVLSGHHRHSPTKLISTTNLVDGGHVQQHSRTMLKNSSYNTAEINGHFNGRNFYLLCNIYYSTNVSV